jgi:hypothetical protein
LISPKITNKFKGSLGELYYKEFCDQTGWAYISLENIHEYMNPEWTFTFKKGFHRIPITIPEKFRDEIKLLVKPTNQSTTSPSFVFDFLNCKVGTYKDYSTVKPNHIFNWAEIKTGNSPFTSSQINAMSKITIPLAIFHIVDVLEKPELVQMGYNILDGNVWLEEMVPIDNEIYEIGSKKILSGPINSQNTK